MKAKYIFLLSGLLLALALGLIAAGWHGTMGVTFSSPISASAFKFSGEATGGWAVGGVLSAIAAVIFFLIAVVRTLLTLGPNRNKAGDFGTGPASKH